MAQLATQFEKIAAAQRASAKAKEENEKKVHQLIRHRLVAIFENRTLAQPVFDTAACLGTSLDKINMVHFSSRRDREVASKLKELS